MSSLLDIRNSVREELQEPEEIRWLDTQLTRYINEGIAKLSRISNVRGIEEFPVSINTFLIPVYDKLHVVNEVFWKPTVGEITKLFRGLSYEKYVKTDTGTPSNYTVENGVVRIYPRPTAEGTLVVRGVKKHPPLTADADEVTLPGVVDIIIAYATWQALKGDGDALAVQYENEFRLEFERYREYVIKSSTQEGRYRDRFFEKYALRPIRGGEEP